MRKMAGLGYLLLVFIILTGCGDDKLEITNKSENNVFVLNGESKVDLEKGIITGTPLRLDNVIGMEDVKKVWGEPEKIYDHEDIQTYQYNIKDRKIMIDEDEMGALYIFQVEVGITREEILHYMGEPKEGKKTGKRLVYHDTDFRIAFEKNDEPQDNDLETWRLIYFESAKGR